MSKVIPFSELNRQHKLQLLNHKRQEYQERENYLARLRKLLFQVEAQMRQAEMEQFQLYHAILDNFHLGITFPNLGDRVGLQQLFTQHPALTTLTDFLEEHLTPEQCFEKLEQLRQEPDKD